jgi:chromosome segregation ATPase
MSALNTMKIKDELLAQLDTAKASYDSAKIGKLEAEIKQLEEQGEEHKEEMKEITQTATQEKTMKVEELKNLLQDKSENAEKNTETIIEQAKIRLQQTIDRYIGKIKELKDTNIEEVKKLKEEVKTEKDTYEKVKKDFFAKSDYKFESFTKEDLKKIPTSAIRYATRENKLLNSPKLTKMATIRRNITMRTLIKKFNKM